MKKIYSALATFAVAGTLSAPAFAEGITLLGATLTSNYVVGGVTQSDDHAALQAYVEHDFANGVYFGVWSSQIDFKDFGSPDNAEIDLYLGHRGSAGNFSWDVAYYRYLYDQTGFDSDELWSQGSFAINDKLSLGAHVRHYFNGMFAGGWMIGPKFDLKLTDADSLNGASLYNTTTETFDWNVGLRHQINETLSVKGTYYDSEPTDPRVSVALSWDTDLSSLLK